MVDREKKAAGIAKADISTELCGIRLDNPVIPASGTFGYGREFNEFYDINCLGTFSFKGTTLEPRFGNPTPRIAECPDGMINAVGLQNPGVEKVISEELPALAEIFHKPVMVRNQHQLSECAWRRHGVRNLSAGSGRGHDGSQEDDEKADAAETFPECDGYYGNRKSL